jgi:stage III sporulation protein SpoIIIAA
MLIAEDFENLLKVLPQFVQNSLKEDPNIDSLVEIVLDLGRMPEARFLNRPVFLADHLILLKDIDFSIKRVSKFSSDNRAGIERTLHRISSIRNRENVVIGLTCRIGRAVLGVISIIRDLIEEEESILILGKPGVGKTTAIREISRILSDEMGKRVVIIDTSNEIAGDGDIPHPAIGSARRMQVTYPELQHRVMIEAVENHMPQVIIIDEISTELEALAARTIAERGVKLIGTAHGNSLESLIKNPTLSDLIGGIQYVTLGDEEARSRGTQKSILERKARPAFKIGLEISDSRTWVVHPNIEKAVDQILQTYRLENQVRIFRDNKFRQIIKCKFSDFSTLYVFENTFLRILSIQKNTLQLNIEGWIFEWS